MNAVPQSERVRIAFFGCRNVGKSSLVNAFTNQQLSIVSAVKGTTTDPVSKAMELLPLGPVVVIDTPGVDDEGELGKERVRRTWKELEEACRRWAANESVYIVCGPILYKSPKYGYIGNKHQIRIPDAFFKVVLTGVESGRPRAVGFIYKNESGNYKRDKYVNTIDEVERITRLDFFSALPDRIEERIEATYDLSEWP